MPHHVVVDGSNLATEGRERPSLQQLNDAVMAYMQEDPDALITVVVDATFGHRIDPREVGEFDEAINNNELVAPPAGAIGRGDAFVLSIANKVNAVILTNDSYQEFHADYPWLFDEGRLVGGKPVPHIGWVFVKRLPVRGPISRKVTAQAKKRPARVSTSAAANQPMPVPTTPPPGRAVPSKRPAKAVAADTTAPVDASPARASAVAVAAGQSGNKGGAAPVNDLLSFLTFVEHHPVGARVTAVVHHYSSHGAYVQVDDVMGYVPLRLMADPPPRSAREFMKVGDTVALVVEGFVADKRSIDLAVPAMSAVPPTAAPSEVTAVAPASEAPAAARRSTKKKAAAEPAATDAAPTGASSAAEGAAATSAAGEVPTAAPAKKARAKKAAAPLAETAPTSPAAPAAPAKKAAAKKAVAKKTVAKKAVASSEPAAPSSEPGTKPAGKKAAPKAQPAVRSDAVAASAVEPAAKPVAAKRSSKKASTPAGESVSEMPAPLATDAPAAKRRGRSAS